MKHRIYITLILAISLVSQAYATVTYSAKWKEVSASIEGPKSAGTISVKASTTHDGYLKLNVSSNYGDYEISNEVKAPLIESLTIHRYSEDSEFGKDFFYVCLFYGDRGRTNRGTEEKPDYHWQHNKVVYLFRPGKTEKSLFKNNEKFWFPSDCMPGSFI
jgi:hypothetical protein